MQTIMLIGGFGAHSIYHSDKLLRLSQDLPIVVEVVESEEKIDSVMPQLEKMMAGGMVTLERVSVIHYGAKPSN